MVNAKALGTGNIPLDLAEAISKMANKELQNGSFFEKISPVTQDLLRFWNPKGSFADVRKFNFHNGQWQAIINTIYVHDVLKIKNVHLFMSVHPDLLKEMDLVDLKRDKYSNPKYCIKMATGTGKTWVMHALLIWQYPNSKNFLFVAPGIIVYERLLDAFLGKIQDVQQLLFLPESYKEDILSFIHHKKKRSDYWRWVNCYY